MNPAAPFRADIAFFDDYIHEIMEYCDADYAQVSLVALGMFGFLLSHVGMKQTSLMVLDFSHSGTGKSHNITLQYNALLQPIMEEQTALQISANEGEEKPKRYVNIHLDSITAPGLYDCFKTVPAQLIIDDELGLSLKTKDDILHTVTKLYGKEKTTLPVLKTEAPSGVAEIPIALSLIGATTLQYFGSKKNLHHHFLGGFANRALIVCNHRLKKPEEIKPIGLMTMDTSRLNKRVVDLMAFLRENTLDISFCKYSHELLHHFRQEIQSAKIALSEDGNANFNVLYNRIEQNTQKIIRIFHALKCYENGRWDENIDPITTESAITFIKRIIYPQIDTLIDYFIDKPKLAQEEKQLERIKYLVEEFLEENGTMPKIRDIQNRTHYSKEILLKRVKGYLEIQPGTTYLRYCKSES